MRTLNRPMFRYGGPIKEGVMDGIRENKNNGGSMGEPQMLNTVGSPYASSSGGRSNYAFNPLNFFKAKNAANVAKVGTGGQTSGIITQAVKNFYNKIRPTYKTQPGKITGTTGSGSSSNYLNQHMVPTSLTSKIKAFGKENPFITAGGVGAGITSGAIPTAGEGLWKLGKAGVLQAADLLVSDKYFDQDKWFEDRNKISNKIDKPIPKTPEEIEAAKVAAALRAEKAGIAKAEFAESEKEKRIANYRKIMDIEGMSKDAAYDSLIDASKIITEEGDFKGSLKDGTLISNLIGATSKRFDKPRDTKDAINTLILKNQMAADTPSTALKDLIAIGIDTPAKQEAYLRTKLGQPSSLSAAEAIVAKSSAATGPSAIAYKAAEMMYGNEFNGNLMDEDSFTKAFDEATKMFGKDKRPNEITVGIISQEARKKSFPPGKYTVGNVVIDLDEEFNVKIIRE